MLQTPHQFNAAMDCNGSYGHSTFPLENLNSVTSLLAWKC